MIYKNAKIEWHVGDGGSYHDFIEKTIKEQGFDKRTLKASLGFSCTGKVHQVEAVCRDIDREDKGYALGRAVYTEVLDVRSECGSQKFSIGGGGLSRINFYINQDEVKVTCQKCLKQMEKKS